MRSLCVTIKSLSAFGGPIKGDTLFGHLCWATRNRHGEERLQDLLAGYNQGRPFAVCADALPQGHLPRPAWPLHHFHLAHQRLEDLPGKHEYDVIVSGLPLNNFAVADVEQILATMVGLLKPGGVLSFFQYVAIRKARALVSNRHERARLNGISRALDGLLGPHEERRDCIWRNLPPAWVHHVRMPAIGADANSTT